MKSHSSPFYWVGIFFFSWERKPPFLARYEQVFHSMLCSVGNSHFDDFITGDVKVCFRAQQSSTQAAASWNASKRAARQEQGVENSNQVF